MLGPFFLSSCIVTYRDFPTAAIGKPPEQRTYDLLRYHINPFPFRDEGSRAVLRSVFDYRSPFANTAEVQEIPSKGVFCLVDAEWQRPDTLTRAFQYLSIATVTVLPSWSLEENYIVRYYLYVDGGIRKTFRYKINRRSYRWLGLLPFIWANGLTNSQAEAFKATALQFFQDAKPIFSALPPEERVIY